MLIKFYNFDFELICAESKCMSAKWNILYNGIGTFEAHFPLDSCVLEAVTGNSYLVAQESGHTAVIIGYDIQSDFVIYGRTCNWLLTKRIVQKFSLSSKTADSIARQLVSSAFSDVTNLALGNALNITETIDFEKDRNSTVSDVITECLKLQNCGHTLEFNIASKQWIYKSLCERESELLLSVANKNAYDIKMTNDLLDLADCGYYERKVTSNSETTSQTTYLTTENTKSGIYRWETLLDGSTNSEALASLTKSVIKSSTSAKTRSVKYGVDYMLGDIVRLQAVCGKYRHTERKRICGVNIIKQNGACSEQPIFEEV